MYKLFVTFSKKKERDIMWYFLNHFDWKKIQKTEPKNIISPVIGEELELPIKLKKKSIGFTSKNPLPQWTWAVMSWMSQHSSVRINDLWAVVHYNDDEFPVITYPSLERHVITVDNRGIMNHWKDKPLPNGPVSEYQKQFLINLNEKWKNYELKK